MGNETKASHTDLSRRLIALFDDHEHIKGGSCPACRAGETKLAKMAKNILDRELVQNAPDEWKELPA